MADLSLSSAEHTIEDPDFGVSYRFKTKSDFMLATFMLGAQLKNAPGSESRFIPIHIINSILHHIRDLAYDRTQAMHEDGKELAERILPYDTTGQVELTSREYFYLIAIPLFLKKEAFLPKEITFVDGAAILRHVAGSKHQAAEKRSFRGFTTAFCNVILQRTLELLVEADIESFCRPRDSKGKAATMQCVCQDVLKNMSLVHRSWTYPAQRAMRIGISVFDVNGLYSFLRSPSCGPWLRAFRYDSNKVRVRYPTPATETTQLLSAILDAAPNLEYLTIGTIIYSARELSGDLRENTHRPPRPSIPGFVDIVSKLPMLAHLKVLCLKQEELFFLPQIWRTISTLHSLEGVVIQEWRWGHDNNINDSLASLSALPVPSRLEKVHVSLADFRRISRQDPDTQDTQESRLRKKKAAAAFISWLVRPRCGRTVKDLRLQIDDIYNVCAEVRNVIGPCFPELSSLTLEGYDGSSWTRPEFISILEDILRHCNKLRTLKMSHMRTDVSTLRLNHAKFLFLDTLESLILHAYDPSSECSYENERCKAWEEMDNDIVELMMIFKPNLRLLDLTVQKNNGSDPFSISELLPKCSSLGNDTARYLRPAQRSGLYSRLNAHVLDHPNITWR